MIISGLTSPLRIPSFHPAPGQSWCIYGPSDSGIDIFLELLTGAAGADGHADLQLPDAPAVISFSMQQEIFEDELRKDDTDFMDRIDPGTPARAFLPETGLASPIIDRFRMRQALDLGYRQLSSGQARKLLLLRDLLQGHPAIVLDSPYDGLDRQSCHELDQAFAAIPRAELLLFVLVRNPSDIPHWCSHLAIFHDGEMRLQGTMAATRSKIVELTSKAPALFTNANYTSAEGHQHPELVRLRNGQASYGATMVFRGLDLTIRPGDHTLVTGPNGCGKSTLLHIITGDHPGCYANDLQVFGIQRGSGETIWELKRRMGIVSPELHRNYRVPGSCLQVVLSGFFDSIGLYARPDLHQRRTGAEWLAAVGLGTLANNPFRQMSYGRQRLVLIARALVKQPPLLLLDEPTQGLDAGERCALLGFLEKISKGSRTTILYVSHRQDEYLPLYVQHLQLERFGAKPVQPNPQE